MNMMTVIAKRNFIIFKMGSKKYPIMQFEPVSDFAGCIRSIYLGESLKESLDEIHRLHNESIHFKFVRQDRPFMKKGELVK